MSVVVVVVVAALAYAVHVTLCADRLIDSLLLLLNV